MLLPDEYGVHALAEIADVRPVHYDSRGRLPDEAREAEVLVPPYLGDAQARHLIHELPRLRLVQLLTAGAEGWIGRLPDGVALSNCRGAHGGSTAEWVLAALLATYRHLPHFAQSQAQRRWDPHTTDTLQGKRVLVIGAGDLGRELRRRFDAFDAATTLVGRTARPGVHGRDELPELLGHHDAVVIVVPDTQDTRGMVDAAFLARMPDNAVLVNAGRGAAVDTAALLAELNSGRLRAALDVTSPEPLPPDHPLWTAPGVLMTPHVGGNTRGGRERAYEIAAREIARFAAGKEPDNLVRGEY